MLLIYHYRSREPKSKYDRIFWPGHRISSYEFSRKKNFADLLKYKDVKLMQSGQLAFYFNSVLTIDPMIPKLELLLTWDNVMTKHDSSLLKGLPLPLHPLLIVFHLFPVAVKLFWLAIEFHLYKKTELSMSSSVVGSVIFYAYPSPLQRLSFFTNFM